MLAHKSRCNSPHSASALLAVKLVDLTISNNHGRTSSSSRQVPAVNRFDILNNILVDDASDNNVAYVPILLSSPLMNSLQSKAWVGTHSSVLVGHR